MNTGNNELIYDEVNKKIAHWALVIPPYATTNDILEIKYLIEANANIREIESKVLNMAVVPKNEWVSLIIGYYRSQCLQNFLDLLIHLIFHFAGEIFLALYLF